MLLGDRDRAPTLDEIPLLNARIAALLAPVSQRTLERGLDMPVETELMISGEAWYAAKTSALGLQLSAKRRQPYDGSHSASPTSPGKE